jgi:hypothetical protein
MRLRAALIAVVLGWSVVLAGARLVQDREPPRSPFARQIAALSEPDGYFDTDNLISNESSYLQVCPDLRRRTKPGGAYVGVGPDQNFTYIAQVRPAIAYIVDVRRDNLLLHLLFKALFSLSRARVDYLAQLFGRAPPPDVDRWRTEGIEPLLGSVERLPASGIDGLRARVDAEIRRAGVPLSAEDFRTIDRFHRRFIEAGPELRFQSTGRPPQSYYPTYRQLLLETDADGRRASYLASEEDFQFLKGLQARDLIVPVVGDLAGPAALPAIGRALAERHASLSAIYVSNVEFYLFGAGTFSRFAANLGRLPHAGTSVLIRSIFGRWSSPARPGDASVSRLQPIDDLLTAFAAGRVTHYGELVMASR